MRFALLTISILIMSCPVFGQTYQLSKPVVYVTKSELFNKKALVTIDFRLEGAELRYSTDGTEPTPNSTLYRKAIKVKKGGLINVKAFKEGFEPSETVSTRLVKLGKQIQSVSLSPNPGKTYAGQGGSTLMNRSAGSLNFRDGQWVGYNKGPITALVDLGKPIKTKQLLLSTLTSSGSWIMPPASIKAMLSIDGKSFNRETTLRIKELHNHGSGGKTYYALDFYGQQAQFIKLIIEPLAELPDWHPGKGNAAWVFLDEIIVY